MIPVALTALVNRPDLLGRMIASVDVPIGRGLVADNARLGVTAPDPWRVFAPPFEGLGWPGMINFGIEQTPDAPWWMVVNNDAYFEPGRLARLVERMDAATGPLVVSQSFTCAAFNRAVIEAVGLFDTWSFFPIYHDDNDFLWRCHLADVAVEHVGDLCLEGDIGETDVQSQTIRADETLARANSRSWQLNHEAYVAKWGGPPAQETYTSPWGGRYGPSPLPLWVTRPDLDGRVARRWP